MEQSKTLLIRVPSYQLRRHASAMSIDRDFALEITGDSDDRVNRHHELSFSGLMFRLTRPEHPHIVSTLDGYISVKRCLIPVDVEHFARKVRQLSYVQEFESYNEERFKALIALEGIFRRDLELRIYCLGNETRIHLRRNRSSMGSYKLSFPQTHWLKLRPKPVPEARVAALRGR